MDDKTRFDQLEEIIVEMLHKLDRTIEDVGRLREAVAAQQLLLVHLQNEISRTENEVAAVRRIATETARVLNKSVAELAIANQRNERLLQDTALILAENRLFQDETRRSFAEIRHELAENKAFRQETKQALAENRTFQDETKQSLAENKAFQDETRTTLAKILDLLTKP
jgi:hypothetical protein